MNERIKLGCVVMAAGNAVRFGSNKLLTELDGKTLIERTLETIPRERLLSVAVVTQYSEIARLAERFGFTAILNPHPEWGQSHTIRLGTEALADKCGAILYLVADQPHLRRSSIEREIDLFLAHPQSIVCMGSGGRRGNPCIFPKVFYPELLALRGDVGGRAVMSAHSEAVLLCEVEAVQLTDVDTPEALRPLRE